MTTALRKILSAMAIALFVGGSSSFATVRGEYLDNTVGLSNCSVSCMFQDSENTLWVGTWDGLNSYNGHRFTSYRFDPNNSNTISNNVIRHITEQRPGVVWVATDYGINRFDKKAGKVSRFYPGFENRTPPDENCFDVIVGKEGTVFCSSTSWGLSYFDEEENELKALNIPGVNTSAIVNLYNFSDESFLLLTTDGKLTEAKYTISEEGIPNVIYTEQVLFSSQVEEVFQTNDYIVAYTSDGKTFISRLANNHYFMPVALPSSSAVLAATDSKDGFLYIALDSHLVFKVAPDGSVVRRLAELDGVILASVLYGTQDVLWCGTDGRGVLELYDSNLSFNKVSDAQLWGMPGVQVRSFYETPDHNILYVASKGRGFAKINKDIKVLASYTTANGLNNDSVYEISEGLTPGHLLIATDGVGLNVFFPATGKIVPLPCAKDGFYQHVYSICPDKDNDCIWLGTNGYGLVKVQYEVRGSSVVLKSQKIYSHDSKDPFTLSNNSIFSVIPAGNGKLWVGTRGAGLNLFDIATGTALSYQCSPSPTSLSNNDVLTLYMDKDSTLWVGTSYGLSSLDKDDVAEGKFKSYTEEDGLKSNTVRGILSDKSGMLWLSTLYGISTLDKNSGEIVNFFDFNDLQNNEFSDGSCYCSSDGRLFFGGIDGFNHFLPNEIHVRDYKPEIVFSTFSIRQHPVNGFDPAEKVVLRYSENFFEVSFHAVDFINGKNCEYQYKLDSFNDDWVDAGTIAHASFTNVPAGRYLLRVRCCNGDKVWNDDEYTLSIRVKRHWTSQWWACIIYLLMIGFVIYAIRQIRIYRNQQKKDIDTYEAKLNFFTSVSHEFSTPLTLIYGSGEYLLDNYKLPPDVAKFLRIIKNNANRMQQLICDLMEFRRVDTGMYVAKFGKVNLTEFINNLMENFTEVQKTKELKVTVTTPDQPRQIISDSGALEKILYNILSNAFKYTPDEGSIQVELKQDDSASVISVTNSGKGIKPSDLQKVFDRFEILDNIERQMTKGKFRRNGIGMALAKNLAESLGGDIMVSSEVDKYTTFTVTLPLIKEDSVQMDANQDSNLPSGFMSSFQPELEVPEHTPTSGHNGTTILVVDDQKQLRDLISEILSAEGYSVIKAQDANAALDVLRDTRPDLIISDIIMPGMDGFELLKYVKSNEMTKNIAFMFLTFKIDLDCQIQGSEYGADAYMQKPFHPKHLVAVVNHILESRVQLKEYYNSALSNSDLFNGKVVDSEEKAFLDKLIGHIEANLADTEFSLDNICDKLNVSRPQLYRKVKALTEMSPSELVTSVRIHHAANLVRSTKKPIQEIMYESGFNNKSYFYRIFDKVFNMTPKQMRTGETKTN